MSTLVACSEAHSRLILSTARLFGMQASEYKLPAHAERMLRSPWCLHEKYLMLANDGVIALDTALDDPPFTRYLLPDSERLLRSLGLSYERVAIDSNLKLGDVVLWVNPD